MITLSEEQYISLLQALNLPIHSKPTISIQQEEEAEPPCKCSGGQQPQTPHPTVLQQTIALRTPAQQMLAVQTSVQQRSVPVGPAQETSGQQTTPVMAATEVPTMLTPAFCWIIEHDQRRPLSSGGTEEVITALTFPVAARKLTYDNVLRTPTSSGAAKKSLVEAEAKESKRSSSTDFVIILSEVRYTSQLQSVNLPIYSKPIINIQQKKDRSSMRVFGRPAAADSSVNCAAADDSSGDAGTVKANNSADVSTADACASCTGTTDTGAANNHRAGSDRSADYYVTHVPLDHRARPTATWLYQP
ncbi:hypothetical protein MRX96_018650 [Rhipicephalus microplus]